MKKALGGCLVAAVVLLLLGGAALWFLVLKPAAEIADRAIGSAREGIAQVANAGQVLARMRELERDVRVGGSHVPAPDGRLSADQVTRFLAVQQAVVGALGPEFARLSSIAEPSSGAVERASALLAGLGDVGVTAKQAQVDALNAQSMSLDEYRWIRERATEALIAGGVSMAIAGAGAAGGEALGRATETAQRLGEVAQQASESARNAAEAARRAADAAREAWRRDAPPAAPVEPAPPDPAPQVPRSADDAAPQAESTPAAGGDEARRANFALVEPHAEAFIRAQGLAAIGL